MTQKISVWTGPTRGALPLGRTPSPAHVHDDPTLVEMLWLSSWWRFVAETIGLLVLLLLLQALLFKGNASGGGLPHLYWIPVILISSQYGVLGGLFATIATTVAYFAVEAPGQSAALDFYAYVETVAAQPAAWLGTALIIGGLRSLHIWHGYDLEKQLAESRSVAESLSEGLEKALGEIRNLEQRIAANASSVAAVSRSLASLDLTNPHTAAAGFANLIYHGAGATDFTIYLKEQGELKPACAFEAGRAVPVSKYTPLDAARIHALSETDPNAGTAPASPASGKQGGAIVAFMQRPGNGEDLGAIVCRITGISQDAAVARRRLNELARSLGAVLSICSNAEHGVCNDD